MSTQRYIDPPLGNPAPLPDGLDLPHHEGLRAHRLVVPRCPGCATWQWPPEVVCWNCHRFGLEWVEVAPRGRVFSWTRTWHPARPDLGSRLPYLILLVELPDAGGIRLLGNLVGPGDQEIRCGDQVTGVFEDSADGAFTLLQWSTVGGGNP